MNETSVSEAPAQICLVGEDVRTDERVVEACRSFNVKILVSRDGSDCIDDENIKTVFILRNFSGEIFEQLQKNRRHILGVPALVDLAAAGLPILIKSKPVYCLSLLGCYLVISGYRKKSDLERLLNLIHSMGGSVVKDVGTKVTHLISLCSMGDKYKYATIFSIPILTEAWLYEAWNNRKNIGYRADKKNIYDQYRLPLFAGNVVKFYGFEKQELVHMTEILIGNGGRLAEHHDDHNVCDQSSTHLVVDENSVELLPPNMVVPPNCNVVKSEWFWNSIQIQAAADVGAFRWREGGLLSPTNKSIFSPTQSLGGSTSRKRKRVRRAELIKDLAAESPGPAHKRRSSVSELAFLSMSGSFLDTSDKNLPTTPEAEKETPVSATSEPVDKVTYVVPNPDARTATPRQQVFHELVTTEANYVAILDCITKIAQEAEDPEQQGGALLDQQEMKIIFGNLPPIQRVHTEMLKELIDTEKHWDEDKCVGSILLKYTHGLLKAYPPFVNFFERTKNQIAESDRKSARFHAFLKKCERRSECARQTLTELMIRPVQRLPSISLLLNDLLKHTRKVGSHPDISYLDQALAKVKEVMTHLNEEKRRTEGQIHIFDIYSEIENCPASVVSSHRSFVTRMDTLEVAAEDVLCGKGYELTLFLFTDIVVVAKRKGGKIGGMIKSPSTTSIAGQGPHNFPSKALKFVTLIHLSAVRRLVDVMDASEAESGVIAIVCRLTEDLRERCYTLQVMAESREEKLTFLRTMCRQVANTMCRTDPESLLVRLGAKDMSLDASDLNVSSFSRAFSSLYKTKQKVGRAFSFNRTPSKFKRAVSSIISPMTSSSSTLRPEYSSHTLGREAPVTPSQRLRELRLESSCSTPRYDDIGSGGSSTPLSRSSRLQSCINLMESPRSSANQPQQFPDRKLFVENENKDPEFRTPNLCSRPSIRDKFRERSGSFAAFSRRTPHNN